MRSGTELSQFLRVFLPTLSYKDNTLVFVNLQNNMMLFVAYTDFVRHILISPGSKVRKKWQRSTQRITAISLFYQ